MSEMLSDKQLAELRAFIEVGQEDTTMPVSFLAPLLLRLLDEVERSRGIVPYRPDRPLSSSPAGLGRVGR